MKTLSVIIALVTVGDSVIRGQGTTQFTVFPYGRENQNGSIHLTELQYPTEAQHWFRGSYMAQTWTSPVSISEVAFRVNEEPEFGRGYNALIPRIEIWLTTTSVSATGLARTFAENAGADARAVFASDNVVLSSPGGAGPNQFGLRFVFSEPFQYDPQAGNLLMRIVTSGEGEFLGGNHIDAHSVGPLASAPAAMRDNDAFPNTIAIGVVAEFGWTPIPEPNSSRLLSIGSFLLLVPFSRQTRKKHVT